MPTQLPNTQASLAAHALEQVPQLAGSLSVLVQMFPHLVVLPTHVRLHWLFAQTSPLWQGVLQALHWAGSLV